MSKACLTCVPVMPCFPTLYLCMHDQPVPTQARVMHMFQQELPGINNIKYIMGFTRSSFGYNAKSGKLHHNAAWIFGQVYIALTPNELMVEV